MDNKSAFILSDLSRAAVSSSERASSSLCSVEIQKGAKASLIHKPVGNFIVIYLPLVCLTAAKYSYKLVKGKLDNQWESKSTDCLSLTGKSWHFFPFFFGLL